MPRSLKFRHRIGLLVAVAAAGLLLVTIVTLVLGRRSEQQVSGVETRYVPLIELDRDLKALFAVIPRALENAAAAADDSAIGAADTAVEQFTDKLRAGDQTIAANGGDAHALADEFRAYYAPAREVSAELAGGRAADQLTAKIEAMRRAQQSFTAHLDIATTPDRKRLAAAFAGARDSQRSALLIDIIAATIVLALMALLSWRVIRRTVSALAEVSGGMERLARGEFGQEIAISTRDELGELALEANRTALRLRDYRQAGEREDWIKTGLGELGDAIAGELDAVALGRRALTYLARYVGAEVAVAYVGDAAGAFQLLDSYGAAEGAGAPAAFKAGESILGQAARDNEVRVLADLPADYLRIRSALGETAPRCVVIVPFAHEGRTMGMLELGLLVAPSDRALELLRRARSALGIAFHVAESRHRAQTLLDETQRQAEELRLAYETLEARNQTLVSSRQELRDANDELAEQTAALEVQRSELARASRYKSEFLANMSHELRTPLNSIMILSKILADNEDRRLSDKQAEFAMLIHKSGDELLALINDVLDMAKVEAGKQDLHCEQVAIADIVDYARRMFEPIAMQRRLAFAVEIAADLPAAIHTDVIRLNQILKNLVSNAFKFTEQGGVTVRIARHVPGELGRVGALAAGEAIAIAVTDTGVGIAPDKQAWIFEAFAQADGGTSRKYGGTGLGLTIARQLAVRLGGELEVDSAVGRGSTFRVVLPIAGPPVDAAPTSPLPRAVATPALPGPPAIVIADDRDQLVPGESCLLIIEDDPPFARVVLDLVRQTGFKALVAARGRAGLELAQRFTPSGIILDVGLPDLDGWSVMEALKSSRATRDIPVHFITAAVDDAERARRMGAVGFTSKPTDPAQVRSALHALENAARAGVRKVLLVERDPAIRASLQALLVGGDLEVEAVGSAREALARLTATTYGCVVANLEIPDKDAGLQLLTGVRADDHTYALPVVIHTGLALAPAELHQLEDHPFTIVVLDSERADERVLAETRLFLHRVRTELPAHRARQTQSVHNLEPLLDGKTVLIVDDDMRNVYSLSSALRAKHLRVIIATDGVEALDALANNPGIDAVLMDVMMPRMDGHEATRQIRAQPQFAELPIIALTAKTMPGEREKCLAAGASDYVPKPIDVDRLVALLRVWLS